MEENISNRKTRNFRNKTEDISHLLYGKVPPQAREFEEVVLGAILMEKDRLAEVIDFLKPECFYVDAHATIYRTILELYTKSYPIDILSVTEHLRSKAELENVGGAFYISELTNKVASTANIEYHARIIFQKYMGRELIRIGNDGIRDAYEDTTDVFELREQMEERISGIVSFRNAKKNRKLFDVAKQMLIETEHVRAQDIEYLGVPSGIQSLDRITGGFRDTDLIIIAARPAMGKTALAATIALNAAKQGYPAGFISLEMGECQIAQRVLCIDSEFNLMKLRNAKYSDAEFRHLSQKMDEIEQLPLYINDSSAVNLLQLKSIMRHMVDKLGCKEIIIDQLSCIDHREPGRNKTDEYKSITRLLKAQAKELNVPVILLHQISRKVEDRGGDKRPNLGDLKDSGAIEEDADIVMLIYREEYYTKKEEVKGLAEIIIAKYRNGATGDVPCGYKGWCGKFHDLDQQEFVSIDPAPQQIGPGDKDDDLPF